MLKRIGPGFLLISFAASVVGAQTAPPKKDIPAIAKAANGSIVTIITVAHDKPIAQGTGFLVSADGVIVTNYHVIETGNAAVVKFPDGTVLSVDGVLAASKDRDLAIIKIHGTTFRTLALGDSDDIQVGEDVVAIGNPLLLESTVSNGIISGVRTSKEQGGKFLQTTAPISPGSSGGPLFNMRGEVIGINTLYLEGGENLNFAIPVNDVKFLLSHQSAKLQDLPNETEPVKSETRHEPIKSETTQAEATPSFSKSSLKDTLRWMQNSLRDEGTSHLPEGGTFSAELTDFSGCRVHFTVRFEGAGGGSPEYFLNLSDIDPTTVVFDRDSKEKPEGSVKPGEEDLGFFGAVTTNKRKMLSAKNPTTEEHQNIFEIIFVFGHPGYGDQFADAFRHAVNLCGGKPSASPPPPPSYYVRSYQHGSYVIEYEGRQLAATCREALSWLDGPDKLGRPMTEHECMYIKDKVGKHIAAKTMWRGDKELRFEPFGQDKADVADVLDVIAEGPIGLPLRSPLPKTSPEILKTLHWIQNTLADREGQTLSSERITRNSLLDDVNGCQVTFVYYQIDSDNKMTSHSRSQVNLGAFDPASLSVGDDDENKHIDILTPVRFVTVHTTDKLPAVRDALNDWGWQPGFTTQSTDLLWILPAPYAARFAKALRQAITLCGGKASAF